MWGSNINILVSNNRTIPVEKSTIIFKNRRGMGPIVRHLQFHKTILKSKLLVYYLGYLIVSMQILTISKMRTTRDNI